MRKIIIVSFIMVLCSLSVLAQLKLSNEEYDVLAVILDRDSKSLLILGDETTHEKENIQQSDLDFEYLKSQFPGILKETAVNFILKNKKIVVLNRKINTKAKYILINRKTFKRFFDKQKSNEDPWRNFYKRYPNSSGYIEFSRVGFSKDKKQAVIYVSNHCGWLCGSGYYYFLEKENNIWRISGELLNWVS